MTPKTLIPPNDLDAQPAGTVDVEDKIRYAVLAF